MKFLHYTLLFILFLPLSLASNDTKIFVSGYVTDLNTGAPVNDHQITLKFKNQVPPFLFFDKTNTNDFGYFSFLIELPFSKGLLDISTVDCSNQLITNTVQFNKAQTSLTTNFAICHSQQTSICHSDFLWVSDPEQLNKVNFKQTSLGMIDEWLWNFGDGNTSTEPDPVHFYLDDGRYEVCLTIAGGNGNCADTYCNTIESNDDTLVQARYTYFIVPGSTPTVQFYDLSLGNVTSWQWDFGDGRSGNVQNPRYTYSSPGTYNVCLIAVKPGNQSDTICKNIQVNPISLCQPSFLTFPDPLDPMTLHFIDVSQGETDSWFWDFGDGQTSELQNPAHSFSLGGIYTVKLTTNNQSAGCEDSFVSIESVVQQPEYIAHFNAFSLNSDELTWRFADLSTGNPEQWYWEFGDGNSSHLENPLHTYDVAGVYEVCLTVSNQDNHFSQIYCMTIHAGIGQDCVAFFSFTPDANNPLTYHFTNASLGDTLQIEWNFGDGSLSTDENPTHTFAGTGLFKVCITISDEFGLCSDNFCQVISVAADIPLQADFDVFIFPQSPVAVQFVNQSLGKYDIRLWSFGDGNFSFENCPQHNFASEGNYDVCLHVIDAETGLSDEFWQTVIVSYEPESIAAFAEVYSLYSPLVVRFADLSTGEIATRNWDFGDGNGSTLKNPISNYSSGGIFEVCLDISDFSGNGNSQLCKEINIEFEPMCEADFDFVPAQNQTLSIQFADLSQGIMNKWEWDFGDGGTSLLQHPAHSYADSGLYLVTLSVSHTDSLIWCNHSFSRQIYVFAPAPECFADFVAYPDSGINKPNLYHFDDFSLGQPDSWFWDFGDGTTSDEQSPIHQFDESGNYQVTLTITQYNPFGTSCSDSKTLEVKTPDYFHIGGFVFAGLFPINNPISTGDTAEILIYRFHENRITPLDTAHFTEMGYYHALSLLPDHYLIKAQLTHNSANSQNYFPTYFGDDLIWQNADFCYIADSNHFHLDINLGAMPEMQQGTGEISGSVIYHSELQSQIVPAHSTVVLLFDQDQNPLSYKFTGDSGNFNFGGLPMGTYYIAAESAGKFCEMVLVALTESNPVVKDIEIEIYTGTTSVTQHVVEEAKANIYPNPVTDRVFVELLHPTSANTELIIYNISGQTLFSHAQTLEAGRNLIELPVGHLKSGIYFLQIRALTGNFTQTLKFAK